MELAVLITGIDFERELGKKLFVVRSPSEGGVEHVRVEADDVCLEAGGDELPRQLGRVAPPEREIAALTASGEALFALPQPSSRASTAS